MLFLYGDDFVSHSCSLEAEERGSRDQGFLTWRQVFRLGCRPVTKARPGARLAGLQGDKEPAGPRTGVEAGAGHDLTDLSVLIVRRY